MPRGRKLSEEEKKQRDANKLYQRIMKKEQKLKNQIEKETKKIQDKIAKQEARIAKQIEKEEFRIANRARIEENKRKRQLSTAGKYYGLVSKGKNLQSRINKEQSSISSQRALATLKELRAIKQAENLQKRIAKEQALIAKLSQTKTPKVKPAFIGPLTKRQTTIRTNRMKALQNLANEVPLPTDFAPPRVRIVRGGGAAPRMPSIRSQVLANQAM